MITRPLLLPMLLALAAGTPPGGEVNEVVIASAGAETEIVIRTAGDVEVRDFLLPDPARLIVDLEGARHALSGYAYEGIGRGGVISMRSSQFREEVVRLVFDLTREVEYRLVRSPGEVRIRFENPAGGFAAWSSGGGAGAASPSVAAGGGSTAATVRWAEAERAHAAEAMERVRARAALASSTPAPAVQQSAQPTISVVYDSANMLDVLAGFASFSGRSIVPGEGVGDKVVRGIDIRDQPWDVALDAILSSQGLGWERMESGIIVVDELADLRSRDTLQTETRVLRINYAGADSVARTLQNLASPKGKVVPYQGTNSVIITDVPSVVSRMDSLVRALDRRTPQVSIEAKIVFVNRTDVNNLGIGYELKDLTGNALAAGDGLAENPDPESGVVDRAETTEDPTVSFSGSSIAAAANASGRLDASALSILASTAFGDFSLFAFIDALEEHTLSDVQAAPSIQVVDNQPARIQVGERTPIRIVESGAQLQTATTNVQFEDTGIILEVTPHVTNNNQILLDLMAERSAVNDAIGGDIGFVFDKQVGETRLLLDDGETAVIGGLTLSQVDESRSGIPGLMNIPLLGKLFRTTRQNENKQDLIILVTPHIIHPVGASAPPPAGRS